jgi:hypothetical protein
MARRKKTKRNLPVVQSEEEVAKKRYKLLQKKFIEHYLACGGVKLHAAKKADIAYSTVRKWFKEDAEFVKEIEEIEEQWIDGIRAALMKRAMTKSDQAAFFLMKSYEPELYDDNIRKLKYAKEHNIDDPDKPQRLVVQLISDPAPKDVPPEPDQK